jgi:hypothetical protein
MSQESVELVRRHLEPFEGEEIVPIIGEAVDRLGPEPEPEPVLTRWADDPSWRHFHPEGRRAIVWGGSFELEATGAPVEMRGFEMRRSRGGEIAVCRRFATERQALEAVGLSE